MEGRILSPGDYRTSRWSGGTTTQLAIWPPEAQYADRRFLWRISTARVELEQSDFTPLPEYERLISILEGSVTLHHADAPPVALTPGQVHRFSGAVPTTSRGRCIDFNLMLRRGQAEGSMMPLYLNKPFSPALTPAADTVLLYLVRGACRVLAGGESYSLQAQQSLLITGPCPMELFPLQPCQGMLCQIRTCAGG